MIEENISIEYPSLGLTLTIEPIIAKKLKQKKWFKLEKLSRDRRDWAKSSDLIDQKNYLKLSLIKLYLKKYSYWAVS